MSEQPIPHYHRGRQRALYTEARAETSLPAAVVADRAGQQCGGLRPNSRQREELLGTGGGGTSSARPSPPESCWTGLSWALPDAKALGH
jgi:hypothetical protein